MPLLIALVFCLLNFVPVSSAAKTLDKGKFLAPGSSSTSLQAPRDDSSKMPGDHSAYGSNAAPPAGGRTPVAPVNGVCPTSDYYCVSTNNGATLKCYPGATMLGAQRCYGVTQFCRAVNESRNAGRPIDESDQEKYNKYCVD